MGSLPRLKKKIELHYRKGSTNESCNCQNCKNIVKDSVVITGRGEILAAEPRCKVMGLQPSRRYRIRLDYTCNAQQLDEKSCDWLRKGEK